jgi:hypothetical protein
MMSDVFNLQEYDALCRSVLGTELPFPDTEFFADAEFLIGGNRPVPAIPQKPLNGMFILEVEMRLNHNLINHLPCMFSIFLRNR